MQFILYICPSTQAAIVAAAPLIARKRDRFAAKVLILRGISKPADPAGFEYREAVRPALAISEYFRAGGAEVFTIDAPPDEPAAWREKVGTALCGDFLDGIDGIMFNAQAGTKQMSFGAWEGLAHGNRLTGRNLPIERCFVGTGSVSFENTGQVPVPPLSIAKHLQLYGFEELEEEKSIQVQAWVRANGSEILKYGKETLSGESEKAKKTVSRLFSSNDAVLPIDRFEDGLWLEHLVYLKALEHRAASRQKQMEVRLGVEIRDRFTEERTFPNAHGAASDYELDLAVSGPGILHIVESKAGKGVQRSHLDLLETLRHRLQGRAGVSGLVSRVRPGGPRSALGQKAASAGIDWVQATRGGKHLNRLMERIFT